MPRIFGLLLCFGFEGQAPGRRCITSSLPFVPTAHIGLALLLQPTLSFVWDVVIFDRSLAQREIIGAAIAIAAIYFGSRNSRDADS